MSLTGSQRRSSLRHLRRRRLGTDRPVALATAVPAHKQYEETHSRLVKFSTARLAPDSPSSAFNQSRRWKAKLECPTSFT